MEDFSQITTLDLSNQGLTELPDLTPYTNLQELYCGGNQLILLPNLPPTLQILGCSWNQLTILPNLLEITPTLQQLGCSGNQLINLPNLPPTLQELYCGGNQLTQLDNLPDALEQLECDKNPLIYDFEPTLENIRKYNNEKMLMLSPTMK